MKTTFIAIATLFIAATASLHAQALRFTFTGTVSTVNPALASEFSAGEEVEFAFTINPATDFNYSNSFQTGYFVSNIAGTFGSYTISGPAGLQAEFLNDEPFILGGDGDGMIFSANNLVGGPVSGFSLSSTYLRVNFPNAFSSDLIDAGQLQNLNGAIPGGQQNQLTFDNSPNEKYVSFDITSASVEAVPEPSTWALMGIGAVALGYGAYRRRGSRQKFAE